MTRHLRYRAFEKEIVRPFATFDSLLSDCRVMVSTSEGFLEGNNVYLTEETDCCQLQIKLDIANLPANLRENCSGLTLAVFHKDYDGAKSIFKIYEGKVSDLGFEVVDLQPILPMNFLDTGDALSISITDKNSDNPFERLASKTFKFLSLEQSFKFPKVYKNPEEFAEAGFSSSAPFAVKWVGEDLDRPINQLVELWLNTKYRLSLETFALSDQQFSKSMMAVTVLTEVFTSIIAKSIEANNFEATASKTVFGLLEKASLSSDDYATISESQDFRPIVCSWAMQILGAHKGLVNEFSK